MPKQCQHSDCSFNVFGGGYCQRHQWKRKLEEKARVIDKSERASDRASKASNFNRNAINKRSTKLARDERKYNALSVIFKRDNPVCKAQIEGCCTYFTEDIHHMKSRGVNFLKIETWLPVCRSCHRYIHDHDKEARELGFIQSKFSKDEDSLRD